MDGENIQKTGDLEIEIGDLILVYPHCASKKLFNVFLVLKEGRDKILYRQKTHGLKCWLVHNSLTGQQEKLTDGLLQLHLKERGWKLKKKGTTI